MSHREISTIGETLATRLARNPRIMNTATNTVLNRQIIVLSTSSLGSSLRPLPICPIQDHEV